MDPERARELLGAERRRIEGELTKLEGEPRVTTDDDLDEGDQGADLYQDELDDSRELDLRDQLAAVERAEARLEAGTYGLSIESSLPIPDERLEAIPTAELTVEEERARGG
jgi:RNA polymerase-binding transcription factor DksA